MTQYEKARDFIAAYMTSESLEQAAKSMNMSRQSAYARVVSLRKSGVNLPSFPKNRGFDSLQIAQLNSLIKQYKKKEQ